MKLLTTKIKEQLLKNHLANEGIEHTEDFKPVVKIFNPYGAGTWLLSEMDEHGYMFGLCDLGLGTPELGTVTYQELAEVKLNGPLGLERDLHFIADKTLTQYASEARNNGRIKA